MITYSSILLLEDDPDDQDLFLDIIKEISPDTPIDVAIARHGAEGLLLLQEKTPEIIFSDVNMPVMDSFQFALALHDNFPSLKIPIVMMSTANLRRDIAYAEFLNIFHFIQKQNTREEMKGKILEALVMLFPGG
ncbi:response regulator [Chitinophaga alhagiae]|uniref:response regulator n=1 Tax=Chitinophaga alhagiae TaxID=2203219 RepID=UPI000E5B49D9|nr:response regulator [Chitinophaga alhagiae]